MLVRPLAGELLIYDLKHHKAFCLNQTAAAIWKSCDGKRNVADLAARLEKEFGPKSNEEIVWLALGQLEKYALLQVAAAAQSASVSRRNLMRAGLATAIALPVITVITAPVAVQAASAITAAVCASRHANDLPGNTGCQATPCISPSGSLCRRVGSASAPCGCV